MSGNRDVPSFALTFSHRGRRKRNEDTVGSVELPGGRRLVVLCDGMGGHAGGDFASRAAVEGVLTRVVDGQNLVDAIEEVNAELFRIASVDATRRGMGTTLVALLLDESSATVCNVGDSRAYRLSPDGLLQQVTRDHSFVADNASSAATEPEQVLDARYKNALTRAVATEEHVAVDVFGPIDLTDGSRLLLCSDGLYKALPDDSIAASCQAALVAEVPAGMTQAVLDAFDRGSDDNISLAVVGIGRVPTRVARRFSTALGRTLDRRLARDERLRRRAAHRAARSGMAGRALRLFTALTVSAVGVGILITTFGSSRSAPSTPVDGGSSLRPGPAEDDGAIRPSLGNLLPAGAARGAELEGDRATATPVGSPLSAPSATTGDDLQPARQPPVSPTADSIVPAESGARQESRDPKCKDAKKC
jgi:protein phosphatase